MFRTVFALGDKLTNPEEIEFRLIMHSNQLMFKGQKYQLVNFDKKSCWAILLAHSDSHRLLVAVHSLTIVKKKEGQPFAYDHITRIDGLPLKKADRVSPDVMEITRMFKEKASE